MAEYKLISADSAHRRAAGHVHQPLRAEAAQPGAAHGTAQDADRPGIRRLDA